MNLRKLETFRASISCEEADTVIAGCGYEPRSTAILGLSSGKSARKIALGFVEQHDDARRLANEVRFRERDYQILSLSGSDFDSAAQVLRNALDGADDVCRHLVVDISSMTRVWYGALVWELQARSSDVEIVVDFVYFPGRYRRGASWSELAEVVGPIDGFSAPSAPTLPVALLMGLGLDSQLAVGLQELIEPRQTVLFSPGEEFRSIGRPRGRERGAERSSAKSVEDLTYPLEDPAFTFALLESIAHGLSESHRVLFVSLGPKMFSLLGFLLHVRHEHVSVWRVSTGSRQRRASVWAQKRRAVCLRTVWKGPGLDRG